MNDAELDRKLRLLDVVNGKPDRSVDHPAAKAALFEEITMTQITTPPTEQSDVNPPESPAPTVISWEPARSKRRRAVTMLAAAAAGVGLVGAGLIIVESGGAQTAEAMILEAAAESAAFTSGQITTTIEIDELGGDPESSGLVAVVDYRFDGDEFLTETTTDIAGEEQIVFGQISVNGLRYIQLSEDEWVEGQEDAATFLGPDEFGMSSEPTTPDSIVDVVEAADDLTVASTNSTTTTFTGTIAATDLVEIGEDLPPGLRLLATGDNPTDDLPTEVQLSVAVTDDLLDQVVVEMDGTSPTGESIDATVTIDYSGYGEPQTITAPDPSQVVEAPSTGFGGFGDELDEALEAELENSLDVLAEVAERRPGLCEDEASAQVDAVTTEEFAQTIADIEACYLAAGEPDAAAAIVFLADPAGSGD